MSLKGKKISVGYNGENIKIYKPLRESIKVPKKEIDINFLKKIYRDYCHSPEGKDKKLTAEEIQKFKNYYIDFFLECGYAEKEIIPQLKAWEVESEKVIDFAKNDKNKYKGTKSDGRTME